MPLRCTVVRGHTLHFSLFTAALNVCSSLLSGCRSFTPLKKEPEILETIEHVGL